MKIHRALSILILLAVACSAKNESKQSPESPKDSSHTFERPVYLEAYHRKWTINVLGKSIYVDAYGWCEEPTDVPCVSHEFATIKQGQKVFQIYRTFDTDPKHPNFAQFSADAPEYKQAQSEYERIKSKEKLIEGNTDVDLTKYLSGYEREIEETFKRCRTSKFGKFVKDIIEDDRKRNIALIFAGAFPLDLLSRALSTTVEIDAKGELQNVGTEPQARGIGLFDSPIIVYESFTSPEKRLRPSSHRIALKYIDRFGLLCQFGQEYSARENHFNLPQLCKQKKYRYYYPAFNEQIDPRASKYIDYDLEDPSKYAGEPRVENIPISSFDSQATYPPPPEEQTDEDKSCLFPNKEELAHEKN